MILSGSTLGGIIISRHLQKNLGITAIKKEIRTIHDIYQSTIQTSNPTLEDAFTFFTSYGNDANQMFKDYRSSLDQYVCRQKELMFGESSNNDPSFPSHSQPSDLSSFPPFLQTMVQSAVSTFTTLREWLLPHLDQQAEN